jgi:hypothetical protein
MLLVLFQLLKFDVVIVFGFGGFACSGLLAGITISSLARLLLPVLAIHLVLHIAEAFFEFAGGAHDGYDKSKNQPVKHEGQESVK